jgi:hypothetical protein
MVPDITTLTIENLASDSKIVLIDKEKHFTSYNIKNEEKQYFKNKIMKNIKYIYIKSETIEGIFYMSGRNHLFPKEKNVKIEIRDNVFEMNGSSNNIGTVSYENYYNKDHQIEDFEIVKENNFNDIYDIIKN